MNNVFDINRFAKLFVLEFDRYKDKLMWVAIATLGLLSLELVLNYVFGKEVFSFPYKAFGVGLVVFSPLIFNKGLDRINSVFDFMLPASTFEKFLVKLVFCVVIMPVFVLLILLLVAGVNQLMSGAWGPEIASRIMLGIQDMSVEKVLILFGFQSFFMLGAYYFRKNVFWKVCLLMIVYFIVLGFVFIVSHQNLLGNEYQVSMMVEDSWSFRVSGDQGLSGQIEDFNPIISAILTLIIPFGMWFVSFLKSRENQV